MGFFLSTPKLDGETGLLQERRACCSCAGLAGDQRSFVVVAVLGKIADLSPCPAHSHVATVVHQRTSKLGNFGSVSHVQSQQRLAGTCCCPRVSGEGCCGLLNWN